MRLVTLLTLFFTITVSLYAQKGKIEGKVTDDKSGQVLSGVSVLVKGTQKGVATDVNGQYIITTAIGPKITLVFSYAGVTKEVADVEVTEDKVTVQDVTLERQAKTGEAVVVRSVSAKRETAAALISFQKNTNTVASVISAESIRRSPDKNTGEVLKRTPGASIQEGKFLVVRGLADRYNQAMLNGILLTSTEPDRKTFSFDIIPSALIDNIIINKAFVPELPGEWAGGLIQVNTRDVPSKNFLNIQIGTGFNTQTVSKDFLKDNGGKMDWLGIDDGARGLPEGYTTKSNFDILPISDKTAIGKNLRNSWVASRSNAPLNTAFQANGGFNSTLLGKTIGATFGVVYSKTNRYIKLLNKQNNFANNVVSVNYNFDDNKYVQDISAGALANLTLVLNQKNKISVKSIINVNSANAVTERNGIDFTRPDNQLTGTEFTFKQNTFFTSQLNGEHKISTPLTFKWYGAFNILDGYIPDQRRILYSKTGGTQEPYRAVISNSLSQQSGSRIYQTLSDYIYTAGGDLSYNFNLFQQKQTLKGGYMFQVKDRLYDAKLFANYLPADNDALKQLPAAEIFQEESFGPGQFAFDAIKGNTFRYMANTILNAGFLQLDNQFSDAMRVVWGVRVENYDQLVGSVKRYDPRHTYSKVTDFLPGINATYKINPRTNFRLSGSQTVIRPELRELTSLNLYDFELNASVTGDPELKRTKISNLDFRYELYPRAGEVITAGVFYKYFANPIEQQFDEAAGGASTFTFVNAQKATSYGVELELRKKIDFSTLLKNFTLQANAAYIYSRVKDENSNLDRPLQGQSPYLLNLGLLYDLEKQGFSATLLFNRIGERIFVVGGDARTTGTPDVYEAPRSILDLQLTKKIINTKGEIRLNISDILNQKQYFYQNNGGKSNFQKSADAVRFSRKYGTTIGVTFNYSL